MLFTFFKRVIWCTLLVLLQALILNNMHFMGYATPFLYIYLLLKFDANMSRYALLLWGFSMGLAVDILSNTPGINAAATTLLALLRPTLLQLFAPRDSANDFTPGAKSMGMIPFMYYTSINVVIHLTCLMLLLIFSLAQPTELLLKILSSSLITITGIWSIERAQK